MAHHTQSPDRGVIAIDVDDVLAQHHDLLAGHYKQRYGVDVVLKDYGAGFTKLIQEQLPDVTNEDVIKTTNEFIQTEAFHPVPIPGAIEAITKLNLHYDLVIVTARPQNIKERTQRWLLGHFADAFQHVEFVGAPGWGMGHILSKTERLKHHKINYLVDDRLENCMEAIALGAKGLLFGDYPWNQVEKLPKGVVRTRDWAAVERELL